MSTPSITASLSDSRSRELFSRAVTRLPGGVNSPVRAMGSIGRTPLFIARGEGAEIIDVDGNRFIDWVCSWGPLICGHANPKVIDAVTETAQAGTSFGAPSELEVELAEEIARRVPSVEMVRMTSSGTEASMTAIRLARAITERETIIKFAGAYHGHVDGLLAQAGSGLATQGLPSSPGVSSALVQNTIVVPWNDPEAFAKVVAAAPPIAAILVEPYPANMGLVLPQGSFLSFLREQADALGALLIFDEVITGFRVAPGGAQEREGVLPDLTVMGKIIGGGLPAAALGGARTLMERLAPSGDVYHAGTLSGNPLAVAAGLATLRQLEPSAYRVLSKRSEQLADGLRQAAGSVPVQVVSVPGLVTTFFSSQPVTNYDQAKSCDLQRYGAWCRSLLARGVYPPASQFEAWFVSLAHGEDHIERTVLAAEEAFAEL